MATGAISGKRREVVSAWFKQLLEANEKQGMAKAAASAWIGTIFGLRTAARLDGNKEWGKVGDDMIGALENAYVAHMGKEGQQQIETTRRLLQYDKVPDFQVQQVHVKTVVTPTMAANKAMAAKLAKKAPAKAAKKGAKAKAKAKGRS